MLLNKTAITEGDMFCALESEPGENLPLESNEPHILIACVKHYSSLNNIIYLQHPN